MLWKESVTSMVAICLVSGNGALIRTRGGGRVELLTSLSLKELPNLKIGPRYITASKYSVATCKRMQDNLGFWIPRCGFRKLGTRFSFLFSGTWILASNRLWDSGFLELYSRFQSPGFLILPAKFSKILDSLSLGEQWSRMQWDYSAIQRSCSVTYPNRLQ